MILGSQTLPTWTWSCTNILKKLKCCYDTFGAHTHGKYGCCRRRGKLFVTSQYTKQGFPYVIGKTPKSFPFSAPKDKAVRRRKTRTIKARDVSSLKLSSPSRARAFAFKLELYRAFVLFTSSLKLGSSFCRALHFYIINFDFEREKSSIELFKIRLDRARALSLFTSSLKKSSSLELEPRLGPTSTLMRHFHVRRFHVQHFHVWHLISNLTELEHFKIELEKDYSWYLKVLLVE